MSYLDDPKLQQTIAKLREIRTREELKAPSSNILRTTMPNGKPLTLRNYQVQGIMHLLAMPRFVLGDDTGLGKCVTGDTLIKTSKGLLEISSLNPNITEADTFAPLQEPLDVIVRGEKRPIKSFYYGGVKPTIKIQTRYGYEIEGSQVHPVLVRQKDGTEQWVRLSEVKEGDFICIDRANVAYETSKEISFSPEMTVNKKAYKTPNSMTLELAMFLGYLIAEGWFNDPLQYHFTISQDNTLNPEVCSHIESLVESLFGCPFVYKKNTYQFSSRYIYEFLLSLGIDPALSKDKQIPASVLSASKEILGGFLKTFIDSESHVRNGAIEISSASEKMLKQIQVALLSFGITSIRKPFKVKGRTETYWSLSLFGINAILFLDRIGLVSTRKILELEKFRTTPKNTNHDVIPYSQTYIESVRSKIYSLVGLHGFKGEGIAKKYGSSFYTTLGHIRNGRRNPSFDYLHKVKGILNELSLNSDTFNSIIDNHYFYDPIVKIESSEKEVFDIEVDHPEHSFVGNGITSHNTLQTISALSYLWDKYPETPVVIMTTKSALNQWASEFDKFTTGVKCFVISGTKAKRQKVYDDFFAYTGLKALIMGYRTACMDFDILQNLKGHVQVFDEATAFKNETTQVHQVCAHLSGAAQKVWSLSATIIKNRLMEAWAIYRVTVPGLMPSKNVFMSNYCICVDKQIGRKRIKFVVGHRKSDIEAFRIKIDPFFIGRPKHEVAHELPPLTTKRIEAPLSDVQISKYKEALSGILEKYDPTTGEMTEKEVTKLTAVMYCQQIVNHPELVDVKGDSGKLEILMELLEEELDGEKVIIFSRFRKMIDILDRELSAKGIKCVRITGGEKDDERKKSQESFQDEKSDVRVVLITMAAAEGVNLQLAKATIFYDSPWSAGDYLQIIGRMIRIGSIHDRVYCYHLVCPKTVDDRVMKALHNKMDLIENVLGKRLKNDEESDKIIGVSENELKDIFNDLVEDAKENAR